jgi:DNA topoisomerase-1
VTASASSEPSPIEDCEEAARAAGLRYVTDRSPGIRRLRRGAGFRYVGPEGKPVKEPEALARIKALAIPPAWTSVWICPDPRGHVQATGRDAKGRKQFRYHRRWREVRDDGKYERMIAFGAALPAIRTKVAEDLARSGFGREKVAATVVQLLERTLIRVGNEEYVRENASFGLTTLRERHVKVEGSHLRFHFRGKSGKEHHIDVSDPRLARIVRRLQDLPGQHLFHYQDDDGALHPIESGDVNAYLQEAAGDHFTAKDFRTWHGTLLAASSLARADGRPTKKQANVAVEAVAARLGNTPAVCKRSYVHPVVLSSYLRGELAYAFKKAEEAAEWEAALLSFLKSDAARRAADLEGTLARSVKAVVKAKKRPQQGHAA